MSDNGGPCQSTPREELERQIMNPNVPKNEREWWAAARIAECERERDGACEYLAAFMVRHSFATGHGDNVEDLLAEFGSQLAEKNRRAEAATARAEKLEAALRHYACDCADNKCEAWDAGNSTICGRAARAALDNAQP